jgi:hypothetical protein
MFNLEPTKVKTKKVVGESALSIQLTQLEVANSMNRILDVQAVYTGNATDLTYVIFYYVSS